MRYMTDVCSGIPETGSVFLPDRILLLQNVLFGDSRGGIEDKEC